MALQLKGLLEDGERADFSKNLRPSLFNESLSNNLDSAGFILLDSTFKGIDRSFEVRSESGLI